MSEPDLQPTLTGSLVTIRPLREDDWEPLFAAACDPLIWKGHPDTERYTKPVFQQFFKDALASGSAFAFEDRATGRIIGSSRYHGHDAERGEIEIGWTFLERACWGGTYNAEIKRLMLEHAFGFVPCVVFMVGEANVRSRRALEKIGARLRDEIRPRAVQGKTHRHVVYEIRRPG
jgi:RimJ/RimL family protein N-acetyltransferase